MARETPTLQAFTRHCGATVLVHSIHILVPKGVTTERDVIAAFTAPVI